ncbi:multidrug efflux system membrane fusion protein [Rhodovulum iodosum]|uniref:Multidrug efflux system membrane fusion protein n=1 Tax=Rhodovulum iodosum TaxID=68291 RepID=A0ABV3XP03_9RHOB|nr:efflux RND transporter periplasmic adaptor subunit [Rhodovulum robiginosum]RSK35903.1 efflux RND transporter periplasmic adaptor subunit [Rhodovulum robiginosum]
MRLISILTAILVSVTLYLMVMERERVRAFAGAEPPSADTSQGAQSAQAAQQAASEKPRIGVVAMKSQAQTVRGTVRVRGRTEAAREVDVRAETSGLVLSEPLRKGAEVAAGDTLCRLDPGTRASTLAQAEAAYDEAQTSLPQARAAVAQAEAQVHEAEINYNAAEKLSEKGYASETQLAAAASALSTARAGLVQAEAGLESAQTAIRTAESAVASSRKDIERLTIDAPFDGLLESDTAELGALLQQGSHCATVIQLDPIKLVGFIPETEVDKVQLGATAGARLATGREVSGKVTFLSRSADEATRTFRVEVAIENPDLAIRDGQTVEIVIAAPGRSAHLLPQSALTLNDDGHIGVRLVGDDGRAHFARIEVLRDTRDGIWVTGLPEAADVIVVGQEFVTDDVPVDAAYRGAGQ